MLIFWRKMIYLSYVKDLQLQSSRLSKTWCQFLRTGFGARPWRVSAILHIWVWQLRRKILLAPTERVTKVGGLLLQNRARVQIPSLWQVAKEPKSQSKIYFIMYQRVGVPSDRHLKSTIRFSTWLGDMPFIVMELHSVARSMARLALLSQHSRLLQLSTVSARYMGALSQMKL